jgi:hypothetical protein
VSDLCTQGLHGSRTTVFASIASRAFSATHTSIRVSPSVRCCGVLRLSTGRKRNPERRPAPLRIRLRLGRLSTAKMENRRPESGYGGTPRGSLSWERRFSSGTGMTWRTSRSGESWALDRVFSWLPRAPCKVIRTFVGLEAVSWLGTSYICQLMPPCLLPWDGGSCGSGQPKLTTGRTRPTITRYVFSLVRPSYCPRSSWLLRNRQSLLPRYSRAYSERGVRWRLARPLRGHDALLRSFRLGSRSGRYTTCLEQYDDGWEG